MKIDPTVLKKLSRDELGDGSVAPSDGAGDDRSGRYWLVKNAKLTLAIKIALITGRPLLLEGPSGTGKSSLARAISETLGWTYYETIVTSQTRLETLTGSVDLVRRLHDASRKDGATFHSSLEEFLEPGVLWWAFDPVSAAAAGQGRTDERRDPGERARRHDDDSDGAVVLIDEIDKAEPDVPNNLLVPLGSWAFQVEGRRDFVRLQRKVRPLICITSNREREMPPAFLRRCVTVELGYPAPEDLMAIAKRHVPDADEALVATVRRKIAAAETNTEVSPAEFIDAVRAAVGLGLTPESDVQLWEDFQRVIQPKRKR